MGLATQVIENASFSNVVFGILGLLTLKYWVGYFIEEAKIRRNGGHAKVQLTSWVPLGLDLMYTTIKRTIEHKNLELWRELFNNKGDASYTVESHVAGRRVIFTADVENTKAILATQFSDYGKGETFHRDWKPFLGDSIFTTDGEQWHASRQLIRPQFVKDRVADLHIFERHVQVLMRNIANGGVPGVAGVGNDNIAQGRVHDLSDLFFRYTLDSATDFLLGHSVNSLETPNQEFANAFGEVQRIQNILTRANNLNFLYPRKNYNAGMKVINDFLNPYIDQVLRISPAELEGKTKDLDSYNFLHALAGFTRDRQMLRDQLIAILLAGRDTTASTLSWTFYELARHPEVFKKLREEIVNRLGTQTAPTYDDLKSMKYLQNVMNETLRLYPVVPFNVRFSLKDTTLPRGGGADGLGKIAVSKDTPIGYSTLVMQRREDLYPPTDDPKMKAGYFNPDRWYTWQPKPWQYIPFNGGPRLCIGQQFALTNMGYTIVRMLQRFDRLESFMPEGPEGEPVLKAEIVLQPGAGVHVAFWEPKGEKA